MQIRLTFLKLAYALSVTRVVTPHGKVQLVLL